MTQSGVADKTTSRKKYFFIFFSLLFPVFIAAGLYDYFFLAGQVSTDDAYVSGNTISVSSQVGGSVTAVNYTDTDYVEQGTVLVSLDKTNSLLAFNKAKSQLANVVREMRKLYVLDSQYQANIAAARIQSQQAAEDYQRRERLAGQGIIAQEVLEHAKDSAISAKAALEAAVQAYNANKVLIKNTPLNLQPQVLQAADAVKQAWLDLQRTDIRSPVSGFVAQRTAQVGETIAPAQPLMAVIPAQQMWVKANFKETQLTHVRAGQPVTLTSDLYGSDVVFHGYVKGVTMGTGNAFSLLPSENASGNWIKVVQRVPVEVDLNAEEIRHHPLRIGLSMNATIETDQGKNAQPEDKAAIPAYRSDALVIDTQPVDALIRTIIDNNGQP